MQWKFDAGGGVGKGSGTNGTSTFGGQKEMMNAWGLGNQHFLGIGGTGTGDRLVDGGGYMAVGHFGNAWGLTSAMVFNREQKSGMIFLVGGPGFDPETYGGKYSSFFRYEERILTALYRHAIVGKRK
jgi:hypothetical protein